MTRLPAAFPYVGGKWRLAPQIIRLLPPHRLFVELFGGSAAVTLAKPRSTIEVLNDIDEDVVNFFTVLRESDLRAQLCDRLHYTPFSRAQFEACVDMPPPADRVLRAWRFYVLARQQFGGFRPANYGRGFTGSTRGRWRTEPGKTRPPGGCAGTFHRQIGLLGEIAERLRDVHIECRDFAEIIDQWDRPDACFYVDAPYVGTEGYYDNGSFGAIRHVELANALNRARARVLVSYYPHPSLGELYPSARWTRTSFRAVKNAQCSAANAKKEVVTELVLCNFKPAVPTWLEQLESSSESSVSSVTSSSATATADETSVAEKEL